MKASLFKIVLPAFAILLAVGLAFATENATVFKTAYYLHPTMGWQEITVDDDCDIEGAIACTFLGQQVYSAPSLNSDPLRKD